MYARRPALTVGRATVAQATSGSRAALARAGDHAVFLGGAVLAVSPSLDQAPDCPGPGRQVRLPAPPVVDDPQFCLRHLAGDVVAKRRAARQLWRGGGVSAPARLRSRRRSATTARAMTSPQYKSADSLTFSGFPITRYRRWRARSGATLVAGIGARKQILARSPL